MKNYFIVLIVLLFVSGFIYSDSISVISPQAGDKVYKNGLHNIRWEHSGSSISFVKIVLFRGMRKIGHITNSTPNDGNFTWSISNSHPEGNYKIRIIGIGTNVFDDSPEFSINRSFKVNLGITVLHDFELRDVSYVSRRGGWIIAKIKNNISPFKGDVDLRVTFPEGGLRSDGNNLDFTKHLNLNAGQEKTIYLVESSLIDEIPFCGRKVIVNIDRTNKYSEENEANNILQKIIEDKNLDLRVSISNLEVKKAYFKNYKWRIKFNINARALGTGYTSVPNVLVYWEIKKEGMADSNSIFHQDFNISSINRNGQETINVDKKFGDGSKKKSRQPRLSEGRHSILVYIGTLDDICEKNKSNNTYRFNINLQ